MNFSNITLIPSLFKILWCHPSAPRLKVKIMNKANLAQQSVPVWWCSSLSFVLYSLPIPPPQAILVFSQFLEAATLSPTTGPLHMLVCSTPLIWEVVPLPILSSSSDVLSILHSDVSSGYISQGSLPWSQPQVNIRVISYTFLSFKPLFLVHNCTSTSTTI